MSRRSRVAAGAVAMSLTAVALTGGGAAAAVPDAPAGAGAAAGSAQAAPVAVVVRGLPGEAQAARAALLAAGGTVTRALPVVDGFAARLPGDRVPALRAAAGVAAVTVDSSVTFNALDPALGYDATGDYGSLHNITKITRAQDTWKAGYTGEGVDIAMIDTGVSPVTGLSSGNVVHGPDLSFESQDPDTTRLDTFGHGTHMASIAVGRDAAGTAASYSDPKTFAGMAPDARLISLKVGAHDGAVDVSQVIAAIDWVVQHRDAAGFKIRVLNLSFGTDSAQDPALDPLSYAAEVAMRKGVLVVVASGNDGREDKKVLANPAHSPHVLTVGASDPEGTLDTADDSIPSWVNTGGSKGRILDVVAPARSVLGLRVPASYLDEAHSSARVGERFFRGSGTSQAAAAVSGAAALVFQKHPNISAYQAKAQLTGTATALPKADKNRQGNGVINAYRAVTSKLVTPPPAPAQGTGTGSLELARGSAHVADLDASGNLVDLTGEKDVMGMAWDSAAMAKAANDGTAWRDGRFNGSDWTGTTFDGTAWAGRSWTGSSWTGRSWTGRSWTGRSWTGRSWTDGSWTGRSWTGRSWTGSEWSGRSWT